MGESPSAQASKHARLDDSFAHRSPHTFVSQPLFGLATYGYLLPCDLSRYQRRYCDGFTRELGSIPSQPNRQLGSARSGQRVGSIQPTSRCLPFRFLSAPNVHPPVRPSLRLALSCRAACRRTKSVSRRAPMAPAQSMCCTAHCTALHTLLGPDWATAPLRQCCREEPLIPSHPIATTRPNLC